jgi:hypothetical protein
MLAALTIRDRIARKADGGRRPEAVRESRLMRHLERKG